MVKLPEPPFYLTKLPNLALLEAQNPDVMKPNRVPVFRAIFFLGLVLLLLVPMAAKAQIQVALKLDRKVFIAHEAIVGELTIINRAGRDLVFGNVNGNNWMDFTITDSRGNFVSPIRQAKSPPPVMIASGQTHKMKVVINETYPMGQIGTYRVKAVVNFPQIRRVFETHPMTIQIANANPFWYQVVGVPSGYPGQGTYRVFELLTYYHGARQKALYFRLKNNQNNKVLACYSLGNYLDVRKPSYKIDRDNQLHIVHMYAPKQYSYTVVDLAGKVVIRETYVEKRESRPALYTNSFGDVEIRGGVTAAEAQTPYERREFRAISERPPGLPRI